MSETPQKGGRTRSNTRKYFTDIQQNGKPRCKCTRCPATLCRDTDTLRNHLNKEHPELKTSPAVCRKRKRISSNGDDYVVSNWKQHDTDDANALLAEFIFEAALPFSVTSHPAFLKWIAKVNKDYTPANRASISGEHLDRVYNNTKEQVEDYVKHSSVVLGVDQSTDGAHEPIAHITVVTTDSTELLWKEIPHYTEEHTAENLMTHLSACVDELEKLGSSVSGIINDNEPKSGAVRQKFHEKYHDKIVFTPGCPSCLAIGCP